MSMSKTKILLWLCSLSILSACSYMPKIPYINDDSQEAQEKGKGEGKSFIPAFIQPFKIDIQQGNFVTEQDTARLKIGMTKDQVRFILGTPLLQDPFHKDRWDYPFRLVKGTGEVTEAQYTVFFENGQLVKHGGENLPENQSGITK
jgi:outer membrane protein assembly factor BamE (lipoprotein component of BamABCDE complex)